MKRFLVLVFLCCQFSSPLDAQSDSLLADSLYAQAKTFYYDGVYDQAEALFQLRPGSEEKILRRTA